VKLFSFIFYLFSSRLARKERDLRSIEARLKQYETELADLKARNEAIVYDNNRKSDDNVVSPFLICNINEKSVVL
jgi:hypothetical protein